jgi:hypothetical protein
MGSYLGLGSCTFKIDPWFRALLVYEIGAVPKNRKKRFNEEKITVFFPEKFLV